MGPHILVSGTEPGKRRSNPNYSPRIIWVKRLRVGASCLEHFAPGCGDSMFPSVMTAARNSRLISRADSFVAGRCAKTRGGPIANRSDLGRGNHDPFGKAAFVPAR